MWKFLIETLFSTNLLTRALHLLSFLLWDLVAKLILTSRQAHSASCFQGGIEPTTVCQKTSLRCGYTTPQHLHRHMLQHKRISTHNRRRARCPHTGVSRFSASLPSQL